MKKAILTIAVLAAAALSSCGSTRASVTDCLDCGLVMGSPGCCQEEVASKAALCACGEVKGSEECCDESAPLCDDCDKSKGSPGCCN